MAPPEKIKRIQLDLETSTTTGRSATVATVLLGKQDREIIDWRIAEDDEFAHGGGKGDLGRFCLY
jgi:hypothetical protein